ncbi:MAG: nucleoside:proton symporter [Acidobacteria bacterium]|nr:nucleoside:proton symporter [Acidobacteriota bacterium]
MISAQLQSVLGVVALLGIAWVMSENRPAVRWKQAGVGLGVTFLLAGALLKIPPIRAIFTHANKLVDGLSEATRAGTSIVFGYLGGGPLPFDPKTPGAEFVLAFQALPIVLVMSVLTTLLYYWKILPPVIRLLAHLLRKTLGVGGAVGLSTAANIFVGMVEAPLFIRPYLNRLTRSELFIVMTGGMAGIAGTMLVLYATILGSVIPGATSHFIIASVMGAPAAILISLIMVPEMVPEIQRTTNDESKLEDKELEPDAPVASSSMDAVAKGTTAGLELLLNIVAMLIVLVALVHLANLMLNALPDVAGAPITLQRMLGVLMAPVCWLMGVPWAETATAGSLMGVKTILNEFIAYLQMAALPAEALSPRSRMIMLYAMCGFANFGSLGIMIGGLATMAPARRNDVVSLGLKSIVSGTLSTCLLGAVVGVLEA